jgi:hypothetical protein
MKAENKTKNDEPQSLSTARLDANKKIVLKKYPKAKDHLMMVGDIGVIAHGKTWPFNVILGRGDNETDAWAAAAITVSNVK